MASHKENEAMESIPFEVQESANFRETLKGKCLAGRKRKPREKYDHENTERWLVSYADFITLLFAFFVTLYAISKVDQQKLVSAAESIQRALNSPILDQISRAHPGSFSSNQASFIASLTPEKEVNPNNYEKENWEDLANEIQKEVEMAYDGSSQIKYLINGKGVIIRVPDGLFFDSGDASIRQEVLPLLNALAKSLKKIPNQICIEGHTDHMPISTPQFPSNWELSVTRATTIVRYLLNPGGLDPERISASGYGEFRPVASNTIPEGRLQNRRVDVVILSRNQK